MTRKVWLEAALNGPWTRERQPGIPVRVEEIVAEGIAAAREGAAIIHAHAYDAASGRQKDDADLYARIVEGIRAEVDVIVYPTIPIAGSGYAGPAASVSGRYAHLDELGRRGLVEWGVCDPGSVNWSSYEGIGRGETGFIYQNPEEHIREGLEVCLRHGIRPSYAIYEPGFARLGAALAAAYPGLPAPVYRLMFSDAFAWGFPPRPYGLDAYLALLAECAPGAPVMMAGLGVDLCPLVPLALHRGVHLRVGLEDAPFGETRGNAALVAEAVALMAREGAEPATASEVRQAVASLDRTGGVAAGREGRLAFRAGGPI